MPAHYPFQTRWKRAVPGASAAIAALAVVLAALPPAARAGDLSSRDVVGALFKAAPGTKPDFSGRNLRRLDLAGLDFKGANLAKADLFGTDLAGSNLSKVDLAGAVLDRATITRANFAGADLAGVSLLRPNVFSSLEGAPAEAADFTGAKLAGAQLSGRFDYTSFRSADLSGVRFGPKDPRSEELITGRVELRQCDFSGANLRGANLSRTGAQYATFTGADLRGANLAGANLKGADFSGSELADADFSGAVVEGASFTGAKGLEHARGLAPPLPRDASVTGK